MKRLKHPTFVLKSGQNAHSLERGWPYHFKLQQQQNNSNKRNEHAKMFKASTRTS